MAAGNKLGHTGGQLFFRFEQDGKRLSDERRIAKHRQERMMMTTTSDQELIMMPINISIVERNCMTFSKLKPLLSANNGIDCSNVYLTGEEAVMGVPFR